jgi:molybdate/tungstate transport system ATP-binding protein
VIHVERLSLVQGSFRLNELSLQVADGRYGVLMGPTGAGKTTILECIAGLRRHTDGRIQLHGEDVTAWPPGDRGIGYLPQDAALFRTMTVRQHLSFALEIRRWPKEKIGERVQELAGWLSIDHLLDRFPLGLSGGEAQRVALGRALSYHPRVLLLDEPLSSLDEETREVMMDLLKRLHELERVTVLHVTHTMREAKRLGDVVFRLENGQIQTSGLES